MKDLNKIKVKGSKSINNGGEGGAMVGGVITFKYPGRPLDQTDNDWIAIRQNIMLSRTVWGRLGEILRREGVYPRVEAMFYRSVEQAVLLFGLDTWLISVSIERKVEGTYMDYLRQITGKRS